MPAPPKPKGGGKFLLKVSQHVTKLKSDDGPPRQVVYTAGQVVESPIDLEARFGSEKFQRVGTETPASTPAPAGPGAAPPPAAPPTTDPSAPKTRPAQLAEYGDVTVMTVAELKEVAAGLEVDLTGCKGKDQILQRLQDWASPDDE